MISACGVSEQFSMLDFGCQNNQNTDCCAIVDEPQAQALISQGAARFSIPSHIEDSETFMLSVNDLLVKYSKHLNIAPEEIMSGGVQHLMNKKALAAMKERDQQQPRRGMGSEHTTFHDLPVSNNKMRNGYM